MLKELTGGWAWAGGGRRREADSTVVLSFQNAKASKFQHDYSKSVLKDIIRKTIYLEI